MKPQAMTLRKYRWSRHYESAEEELKGHLSARNIDAERWSIEAGEAIGRHSHTGDTQFFCAEGSLSMTAGDRTFSLQPGDALDLPAGTEYEAVAGLAGAVCYESQALAS